jgi:prophage antirepressor-like protein
MGSSNYVKVDPAMRQLNATEVQSAWREAVLDRDGHKCVICGSTELLEAHHIKSKAEFPELACKVENGETLCRKCHNKVHNLERNNVCETFYYKGKPVRTIKRKGGFGYEPWFVAKDACDILELKDVTSALRSLDQDEYFNLETGDVKLLWPEIKHSALGLNIVSEPGLYKLIFKSRMPEAKAFTRWVTHRIIPEVMRKVYNRKNEEDLSEEQRQEAIVEASVAAFQNFNGWSKPDIIAYIKVIAKAAKNGLISKSQFQKMCGVPADPEDIVQGGGEIFLKKNLTMAMRIWIKEKCMDNGWSKASELFAAFSVWYSAHGGHGLTLPSFSKRLSYIIPIGARLGNKGVYNLTIKEAHPAAVAFVPDNRLKDPTTGRFLPEPKEQPEQKGGEA